MNKNEGQSSLPVIPAGSDSRYLEHAAVIKYGLRWRLTRHPYRILSPAGYDVECNLDVKNSSIISRSLQ